ncbi:MAG TPA: hypothetical protein VKK31_08110 [Thermoanaerobaculia bacterium]|nr:hypothetical protein [Thermoanaerobaculia bacterium]
MFEAGPGRATLRLTLLGGVCALGLFLGVSRSRLPNVYILAGLLASYLLAWAAALWLGRGRRGELVKGFAVTSAAAVLLVAVLEMLVLLHLVDFRVLFGTPAAQPWSHPGNLVDPALLHLHQPHDDFVWDGVRYQYDQSGFRNRPDPKAADVVVVGDSFIEGWGVTAEELATSRLAADLGRPVVNLGQSWYGPQQELEVLRRYGLPLHPKACVWAFFEGNDLQDVERYEKALPVWPELSRRNHSFALRSFTRNALYALRRLLGKDATGTLAYPSGVFRASGGRDVRMYFEYKPHRLSAKEEAALGEVRSVLTKAGGLCRSHGARFLVVFVPSKDRIYLGRTRFAAESEPLHWGRNGLPRRLAGIVRQADPGAEFLDLTPSFLARAARGEVLYFPQDSHWSPLGHAAAADAIAARLTGSSRVPPRILVKRTGTGAAASSRRLGG